MEPWYKVATLLKEVREGRSFHPDEFAIHLGQVITQFGGREQSKGIFVSPVRGQSLRCGQK